MEIIIKEVKTKKDLNVFVDFQHNLYKNNKYFVPPLKFDEKATLSKDKNPAFENCEARYWLAYKGNKVVGRVAAILNKAYIKKWKNNYLRFGWIDFEDDENISKKLLEQVENWAKELGMTAVHGPLGFTDLDHEGMLVEGYNELGTLAAIYNHPYYPKHLEKLGYIKDTDWIEFNVTMPNEPYEKVSKLAEIVKKRYNVRILKTTSAKQILPYGKDIFGLINEAYSDLYGVVELTDKQIAYYTKQYFGFVKPDFLPLVVDKNNKLIAFAVTMPSLSKALQKNGGSLFPFGFIHLLQAMRKNDTADLYLIAISREYQGKGINALLMDHLMKVYIANGIKHVETNYQLEDNTKVQSIWQYFDARQHKRRRCFIKQLS